MASQPTYGAFVPTTTIWDVSEIENVDIQSPQFKELLVRLYQNINNIASVLNVKDTGIYVDQEMISSQLFFANPALSSQTAQQPVLRSGIRKLVICGALPNTGTKTIPHGITMTSATTSTRVYGAATDPIGLNYIGLSYASPIAANNIELSADATNITITTGSDRSNFTNTLVIVEYLQT